MAVQMDSAGPGELRPQRARRRLALWIWSITTVVTRAVAWVIYDGVFEINTCFLGTAHGGRAQSEGWAVFIGFLLMLLAAILAFRWRRRLLLLFAAFLTAYVACLIALWVVSPAIWGSVRCTFNS
jgi:LPXTG-motif cell wall-anchored protein